MRKNQKRKECVDCAAPATKTRCKPCGYKARRLTPWNKGTVGLTKANKGSFVAGLVPWNKDLVLKEKVTYKELHRWVAKHLVRPENCTTCGNGGRIEWANISREYKRDLSDWVGLCVPCHRAYDSKENRGAAVAIFGKKEVACR